MKRRGRQVRRSIHWAAAIVLAVSVTAAAQTPYQPKFKGDPASRTRKPPPSATCDRPAGPEAYYKNNKFAASLADLVHSGSFTKRMVNPDRGDYSVGFRPNKDGFELTLTPKQLDAEHRSFYADEDGQIHADDQAPAKEKSPPVK